MADNKYPVVTFVIEEGSAFGTKEVGTIKAQLYPDLAPESVNNFISLANSGFYDGLIFHRVIPGFMIQGGDPKGNGTGGPGYCIKGEFKKNGVANNLHHGRGTLSMARAGHPDSAGSQFFIMHADAGYLDGDYAAFGEVIEGLDVVDKIANVSTNFQDKPRVNQIMKSVSVETWGVEYPEPNKLKDPFGRY